MSAPRIGALVLFTGRLDAVLGFYRTLGLPLAEETHDDGPVHYACDLDGQHFAVFESGDGDALPWRSSGSTFHGFAVDSVDIALAAVVATGAPVLSGPSDMPWGRRAVVADPDGRAVELWEPT